METEAGMGQKRKTTRLRDTWNTFGLRVLDYNVELDWGHNSAIHDKTRRSDESPVYESNQYLNLDCVVLWPDAHSGQREHRFRFIVNTRFLNASRASFLTQVFTMGQRLS